jgi:hypothetical protein
MRYRDIILVEGRGKRVTAESGHPFVIIENPTPAQLRQLLAHAAYGCKAMLSPDGRSILVWNGYHAEHYVGWNLWHGLPLRYRANGDLDIDPAAQAAIALHVGADGVSSDSVTLDRFKNASALTRMYDRPFTVSDSIQSETVDPRVRRQWSSS